MDVICGLGERGCQRGSFGVRSSMRMGMIGMMGMGMGMGMMRRMMRRGLRVRSLCLYG